MTPWSCYAPTDRLGAHGMTTSRRWIVRILVLLAAVLPLSLIGLYALNPFGARSLDPRERILGYGLYRIPATSMAPNFNEGDIIFVRAGYYTTQRPQRGEVVTALAPGIDGPVLKRIVGLPGETVAIEGGRVLVDGDPLDEPYVSGDSIATPYSREFPSLVVPEGHYFLLGDNRDNSADSRLWGVLARTDLLGKVVGR